MYNIYIYIYIHTHVHTYMHIYTFMYSPSSGLTAPHPPRCDPARGTASDPCGQASEAVRSQGGGENKEREAVKPVSPRPGGAPPRCHGPARQRWSDLGMAPQAKSKLNDRRHVSMVPIHLRLLCSRLGIFRGGYQSLQVQKTIASV